MRTQDSFGVTRRTDSSNCVPFITHRNMIMFIIQNDIWMYEYDYRSYWRKFIHFVNLLCVWFIIPFRVMLPWLSHKLMRTCLAKMYIVFHSVQFHIEIFIEDGNAIKQFYWCSFRFRFSFEWIAFILFKCVSQAIKNRLYTFEYRIHTTDLLLKLRQLLSDFIVSMCVAPTSKRDACSLNNVYHSEIQLSIAFHSTVTIWD